MKSSLKFGTSGLRGLVTELDGGAVLRWTRAFLTMLEESGDIRQGEAVFVARDLRSSSPSIAGFVTKTISLCGFEPVECGALPTPALALYAMQRQAPAIMVTGSHIPDDRNGLKFYSPHGEIDKRAEIEILRLHQELDQIAELPVPEQALPINEDPGKDYVARYSSFFGVGALNGVRVGIYQHSSVARDLLVEILNLLGAETVALGRADHFVPVDTEALDSATVAQVKSWAKDQNFDAIVSTDGDADRPLVFDEQGAFVRGDLVGAMTARNLGADCIVTPVTSNSSLESCGHFSKVQRTRVGSPYVIEEMQVLEKSNPQCLVGFEANGGTFLSSKLNRKGTLQPLLTRDAVLPILCCLVDILEQKKPLSALAKSFEFRVALSDRLQEIPRENALPFLQNLIKNRQFSKELFSSIGEIVDIDDTDGVRISLRSGEVVHYRMSGNAPELRCYVEADVEEDAKKLLRWGLQLALDNVTR